MLDVRRLRMLHELQGRETVGQVAAALHQSPSSISQGLALLEREAGVPLLRRSGRLLELTEAGHLLADRAGTILALLAQAEADVHGLDGTVTGQVRIAAFQSAALSLMPAMLALVTREHPGLRVTMTQRDPAQSLRWLHTRDVDLTVSEEYPGAPTDLLPEFDRVELAADRLSLAVPTVPGPWDDVADLVDARALPWVLEPVGTSSRSFARRTCNAAGFEPDARFDVDDLETQLTLIEAGHAVTILPDLMLAPRPRRVRLVELPGDPHRALFTVTRRSLVGTAAVTACRDALARVVAEGGPANDGAGLADAG